MLTVMVTMEVDIGYKQSGNRGARDELGCNCGDAMMRWFGGTDVIV